MDRKKPIKVEKHPLSELDTPVLPPASSRMTVDLLVNEKSEIWLLYDKPFKETIKWAEYDLDLNKINLVMVSGRQQELGFVVPDDMQGDLQYGREIYLIQMNDKKVTDCGTVPLMVRGTIH